MEKKRILMDFVEARNFYDCPQMLFLCSSISIVSLLSPREWTSPEKMRSVPVLVISPRSHTTNRIIGGTKKGSGLESKKKYLLGRLAHELALHISYLVLEKPFRLSGLGPYNHPPRCLLPNLTNGLSQRQKN
jgi:hypothetical protein